MVLSCSTYSVVALRKGRRRAGATPCTILRHSVVRETPRRAVVCSANRNQAKLFTDFEETDYKFTALLITTSRVLNAIQ
ncbi:unnamed protein product, partial [Brenthis ino]